MEACKSLRRAFAGSVAVTVLSGLIASAAHAQDASPKAAEESFSTDIVVTANRRSERLQDVPISVNVISNKNLSAAAISDSQLLASLVPGLSVYTTNLSQYYLRGVGTSGTSINTEQSVSTYLDGVYIYSTYSSLSLANLERVEVLRGPQGTLFGRNTTGGVIQGVTRNPLAEQSLEASIGYGNYRTLSGNFYGNAHLAPNLGAALSVDFKDQSRGYGYNSVRQVDIWKRNNVNVRGKLAFEATADTKITALAQYRRAKDSGTNYIPLPGTRGIDGVEGSSYGRFESRAGTPGLAIAKDFLGYIKVEQGLGNFANLTSITAYRDVKSYVEYDQDGTPVNVVTAEQDQKFHNFSQEFQLSSKGDGRLTWLLGAFYFNALAQADPITVTGAAAASAGGMVRYFRAQRTKSLAGFGQATYKLTPSTNLTAGVRYSDETQSLPKGLVTLLGPDPAPIVVPYPPVPLKDVDSSGWTWRLALDQKLSQDIMGYISWNHGSKAGGFSLITLAAPPGYKPEKLDAYEAGLKMELLDGTVRLNPALFLYKFKDIQFSVVTAGGSAVSNAAAATIKGLDIDAAVRISRHLQITGAFEYLDSKYDRFNNAIFYVPRAAPLGGTTQLIGQNASGKHLPYAPKTSGNIGFFYSVPLNSGEILLEGSARYVGGQFIGASNFFKIPSYTLVSGGIGWTSENKRFGVRIWGDNILNEKYDLPYSESGVGVFRNPGQPRTYGITLSTKL